MKSGSLGSGGPQLPSAGSAGAIIIGPGFGSGDPTGSGAGEKWSIVNLLYGTDRKRRDLAARIGYGSERGRKLEIGQAVVTVPKSHTVPSLERPWTLNIPYLNVAVYQQSEDPARHFTLSKLGTLDRRAFLDLARQRIAAASRYKSQAIVFIHGFNTGFDTAIYRGAQLAYDLRFDGPAFVYSWPSGGGFTSYTYDRESAEQSVPYLRQFLETVLADSGAQGVSIIAHSMGNKPLLEALNDLRGSTTLAQRINQIILAAPDVDRDGFENIASQIRGLGRGITLYASANDRAMSASRRFHGGIPRAGDVPKSGPVIVKGVDTIDVTGTSTEIFALNHSGYAENAALLNDIELLLQTGERPPERRVPILERISTGAGIYWRYPSR